MSVCPTCKGEKFVDNVGGNCSRDFCRTCGGAGVIIENDSKRLERALVVIDAVLAGLDPHTECDLCETVHPDHGGDWEHSEECPLVTQGFITVEGQRLFQHLPKTAGDQYKLRHTCNEEPTPCMACLWDTSYEAGQRSVGLVLPTPKRPDRRALRAALARVDGGDHVEYLDRLTDVAIATMRTKAREALTFNQFEILLESFQDPDTKRTPQWLYQQIFGEFP